MRSGRHILVLVTGLALCVLPAVAQAHHFKGLPHFNYFENYPQVPQEEYLWQEGEHEFSLVLYDFQGITRDDVEQPNDVRIYLVIWSLREGKIYNGPITVDILDQDTSIIRKSFLSAAEESIYSLQRELPETGRYALAIRFDDDSGVTARIPFKLSSQKVPWGKWVAVILVILVAVLAVGSRRARILQDRKTSRQRPERELRTHG